LLIGLVVAGGWAGFAEFGGLADRAGAVGNVELGVWVGLKNSFAISVLGSVALFDKEAY
jgi:hypothetical protein